MLGMDQFYNGDIKEDGKDAYIVPPDVIGPEGETLYDKVVDDVLKQHLVTPRVAWLQLLIPAIRQPY